MSTAGTIGSTQRPKIPVMTPPAVSPEGERDRISNWKIGLLAAGSAVAGAVATAVASIFIAQHQIDATAKQNRQDYLRPQQESGYAAIITGWDDVDELVVDCAVAAKSSNARTKTAADYKSLQAATRKFFDTTVRVGLVGSDDARRAASALYADMNDLELDCAYFVNKVNPKLPPAPSSNSLDEDRSHALDDLKTFELAARRDVANG